MAASPSTSFTSKPWGTSRGTTAQCATPEMTRQAASASRIGQRFQKRSGPVLLPRSVRGVACGAVGAPCAAPVAERRWLASTIQLLSEKTYHLRRGNSRSPPGVPGRRSSREVVRQPPTALLDTRIPQ